MLLLAVNQVISTIYIHITIYIVNTQKIVYEKQKQNEEERISIDDGAEKRQASKTERYASGKRVEKEYEKQQ